MRPAQRKHDVRGRGRDGRGSSSRSLESSGPDVRIRGSAQHIAERYVALARDAALAGDRVTAENYLQHAEHYGRLVAAAQGSFRIRDDEAGTEDEEEDEEEDGTDPGPGGEADLLRADGPERPRPDRGPQRVPGDGEGRGPRRRDRGRNRRNGEARRPGEDREGRGNGRDGDMPSAAVD